MQPLQPTLQSAWDRFALDANVLHLHANDLKRFAAFVEVAYHPARRKDPVDFRILIEEAWPGLEGEEVAELDSHLGELYTFGLQLLAIRAGR
jgi:hypothetical protein